jgi:hypothetical protein
MNYINLLRCADSVAEYSFGIPNTTHHVPFLSRSNQSFFAIDVRTATSTNHSNCIRALRCDSSDKPCYPFSYLLASWFCCEVSTTCYSPCALVPLRASRHTFFPQHLLHSYNHRSYQWSLGHPSEQACLSEPLLAELCRHTSFGCVTTVILCNAGRTIRYRTLNCPKYLLYDKCLLLSNCFG